MSSSSNWRRVHVCFFRILFCSRAGSIPASSPLIGPSLQTHDVSNFGSNPLRSSRSCTSVLREQHCQVLCFLLYFEASSCLPVVPPHVNHLCVVVCPRLCPVLPCMNSPCPFIDGASCFGCALLNRCCVFICFFVFCCRQTSELWCTATRQSHTDYLNPQDTQIGFLLESVAAEWLCW